MNINTDTKIDILYDPLYPTSCEPCEDQPLRQRQAQPLSIISAGESVAARVATPLLIVEGNTSATAKGKGLVSTAGESSTLQNRSCQSSSNISDHRIIGQQTQQKPRKIRIRQVLPLTFDFQYSSQKMRLVAQITLAQEVWYRQPEASATWIEKIYNTFSHMFLQRKCCDFSLYSNALRKLYDISKSSLIYACLCISDLYSGRYVEAETDELLRRSPNDVLALTIKGMLYTIGNKYTAQDREKAQKYLVRALEIDYKNSLAWHGLALCNAKKAYDLLQKALVLDPENPMLLESLAMIFSRGMGEISKQPKKAYDLLIKACFLDQNYAPAYAALGELLLMGGDGVSRNIQAAYELLLKACNLDPDNALFLAYLGEALWAKGRPEKAYSQFIDAYRLAPNSSRILTALGDFLRIGGGKVKRKLQWASDFLTEACNLDPDNARAHASLGELLRTGGDGIRRDVKKAHDHLSKACLLDPDYAPAHACLGELLRTGGDGVPRNVQEAQTHLKRACELNPSDVFSHVSLAELMAASREEDQTSEGVVST